MSAQEAIAALADVEATVAVAESLTGGLVCAALTEVGGSSAGFMGGVVSYTVLVKERILEVDPDLLSDEGPVDPGVARQMARGVARVCGATIGVSTTGVAGPTWHGGEPPGKAFVGWSTGETDGVIEVHAGGDRATVRRMVTEIAVQVITQCARHGAASSAALSSHAKCVDRE